VSTAVLFLSCPVPHVTLVRDKAQPYAQLYEPYSSNLYTEQENLAEYDYANLTPLKAQSAHHTSTEPELERERSCDVVLMAWGKTGGEIRVKKTYVNVTFWRVSLTTVARETQQCLPYVLLLNYVCLSTI
jgi:hypothetical protein